MSHYTPPQKVYRNLLVAKWLVLTSNQEFRGLSPTWDRSQLMTERHFIA